MKCFSRKVCTGDKAHSWPVTYMVVALLILSPSYLQHAVVSHALRLIGRRRRRHQSINRTYLHTVCRTSVELSITNCRCCQDLRSRSAHIRTHECTEHHGAWHRAEVWHPWSRGGDGGLRPCMDDSDGMGVQQVAGHSPAGFYCPLQAPKNWANPSRECMEIRQLSPMWSIVTADLEGEG